MPSSWVYDLVVLAADKSQEVGIKTLLESRWGSLGIRQVRYQVLSSRYHDSASNQRIVEILRSFLSDAQYALVVMDYESSGREEKPAEIEEDIKATLAKNSWKNRAEAIVIDPELEIWVWSDSPHVDEVLDWKGRTPPLRDWLRSEKMWGDSEIKPSHPKEALEKALAEVLLPRSSGIFKNLAEKVGLERCSDTSFLRLKDILRNWFPQRQ